MSDLFGTSLGYVATMRPRCSMSEVNRQFHAVGFCQGTISQDRRKCRAQLTIGQCVLMRHVVVLEDLGEDAYVTTEKKKKKKKKKTMMELTGG